MRILVANRGEIATRIIRTATRLGFQTVAVFADPDRGAPHVRQATMAIRLGPADLDRSYLSIEALVAAAEQTASTAVHPGYGFLSERADFARAVEAAGLLWVGPRPEAIEIMGSKIEARRLAARTGIPIVPGFDSSQDDQALTAGAHQIGFPVLVKASAGGGGKGIRIAFTPSELPGALSQARSESRRSFGDAAVIVERYITRPRHVEVQIVGDKHGNVVDFGTRECSVQRRYQKLMEEAPAPNISEDTERMLRTWARAVGAAVGYDSVGTVEFVLDDRTGEAFFLEMNTRLQVEHPVTEAITGLDLVEIQIRVATGEETPFPLESPPTVGHAFEARINAEDPSRDFMPQTGSVSVIDVPPGVRWDSGIDAGSVITPFYDSMLGKLIVHGPDRNAARRKLLAALDQLLIGGVRTNTGFQRWLLTQDPVVAGRVTTRFLDESGPMPAATANIGFLAAAAWLATRDRPGAGADVWHHLGRRRFTPHDSARSVFLEDLDGQVVEIVLFGKAGSYVVDGAGLLDDVRVEGGRLLWAVEGVEHSTPAHIDVMARTVSIAFEGTVGNFSVRRRIEQWNGRSEVGGNGATDIAAPFPAVVTEVKVAVGDLVESGVVVVVIEAMKMLHSLTAGGPGVVASVRVAVGDQVGSREILITFKDPT